MTDDNLGVAETWYEDFFSFEFNEFWRRCVPPEATAAEVAFLRHALAVDPPARLLDVPCGSGRHSLALATLGYRIVGQDISTDAITHARRNAAEHRHSVTFRQGDMRDLPEDGGFDGAYCLGNSFGYLDEAGMDGFVAALAKAVRPGGRVVVDSAMVAECLFANWQSEAAYPAGDITLALRNAYDPRTSRLRTDFRLTHAGRVLERSMSHRVYRVGEIVAMLGRYGLETLSLSGGTGGEPFEVGSHRLLLTAQRT